MDEVRIPPVGDPFTAHDGRTEAQEGLLEAAEAVLAWLYDRRAHVPEELLDHREERHRKALKAAIHKSK